MGVQIHTARRVAKERICWFLQGNREARDDNINSLGRENIEAIAIIYPPFVGGVVQSRVLVFGET